MSFDTGDLVGYLGLDDTEFNRKLDAAQGKMGRVGDKLTGAGQKMSMGVTLPALALAAVTIDSAAKFETSMNQVQVATGSTAADLQGLSDYAKQMGADTVYSAGEAADAMLELAKSGMSGAQIKAGGLKAAMDLAAAGGLELADAADTTSNAMHAFGISAEDAGSVAAALAGGANASTADVSDLAQALAQVGPGAKNAGLDLQDTVSVLAAFADKGIQGADAGTSLKTMLANLVPQTDKQAKAQKALGLSFVDSKGNIDDISVVADKLKDRLGGLSQAQRMSALNTLFGSDATRAATVLMEDGAKGLEKYEKATRDQSAATKMADARMKGLGGALENMKGSLETAGIEIGDVLAPGISKAAGALKWLADEFSKIPTALKYTAVGVGTIVAAIGPLLILTGTVLKGFERIRDFRFRQTMPTVSGTPGVGGAGSTTAAAEVADLGRAAAIAATEVANLGRSAAGGSASALSPAGKRGAGLMNQGASAQLGTNAGTAEARVGKLGTKAEQAAPQLQLVERSSRNLGGRMGRLSSAMGSSTVGTIAATIGLGLALEFTIPEVLKAADAFGQWVSALGEAHGAENDRKGTEAKSLKYMADKYGEDSPQYKQLAATIKADNQAQTPIQHTGSPRSGMRPVLRAAGGDDIVTRPTLYLAGEAGPERATFTPVGKGGGPGHTFDFRGCSFNAHSPRELVEQVKSMIMDDVIPAMAGVNIG